MFLHHDLLHLLSNVWFLWVFGENLEKEWGAGDFFFFIFFAAWPLS